MSYWRYLINVQKGRKNVLQPPAGTQKCSLLCGIGKAMERESLTMFNVFFWIPTKSFQTGRMSKSKRSPGGLHGLPEAGNIHNHQRKSSEQQQQHFVWNFKRVTSLVSTLLQMSAKMETVSRDYRFSQGLLPPRSSAAANACVCWKLPEEDVPCLQHSTEKHTLCHCLLKRWVSWNAEAWRAEGMRKSRIWIFKTVKRCIPKVVSNSSQKSFHFWLAFNLCV